MSESSEDFVRSFYPDAMLAREVGGKWTVFNYMGGEEIGSGTTPIEAWSDAARRIPEDEA